MKCKPRILFLLLAAVLLGTRAQAANVGDQIIKRVALSDGWADLSFVVTGSQEAAVFNPLNKYNAAELLVSGQSAVVEWGGNGELTIPGSITDAEGKEYIVTTIGADAFARPRVDRVFDMDLEDYVNRKTDDYDWTGNLSKVILPEELTRIGANAFRQADGLRTVVFNEALEAIGDSAFFYCYSLSQNLMFQKSLKSIGKGAFFECRNVYNVYFTGTDMANLEWEDGVEDDWGNVYYCFREPWSTTLHVGESALAGFQGNENIAEAWRTESNLLADAPATFGVGTEIVQEFTTIWDENQWKEIPFYITYTILDNKTVAIFKSDGTTTPNTGNVCTAGGTQAYSFDGKPSNACYLTLPSSIEAINGQTYNVSYIGHNAFKGCDVIYYIHIPGSIREIGTSAFEGVERKYYYNGGEDYSLESIWELSFDTDRSLPLVIGQRAFANSRLSIGTLALPEGLTEIRDEAFLGGTDTYEWGGEYKTIRFTTIQFPTTLQAIGNDAFYNVETDDVFFNALDAKQTTWTDDAETLDFRAPYDSENNPYGTKIHTPKVCREAYRTEADFLAEWRGAIVTPPTALISINGVDTPVDIRKGWEEWRWNEETQSDDIIQHVYIGEGGSNPAVVGAEGKVIIPEVTSEGYYVDGVSTNAFMGNEGITEFVIAERGSGSSLDCYANSFLTIEDTEDIEKQAIVRVPFEMVNNLWNLWELRNAGKVVTTIKLKNDLATFSSEFYFKLPEGLDAYVVRYYPEDSEVKAFKIGNKVGGYNGYNSMLGNWLNYGFLLKGEAGQEYELTSANTDDDPYMGNDDYEHPNMLVGTIWGERFEDWQVDGKYILVNNAFHPMQGSDTDEVRIGANKAYLDLSPWADELGCRMLTISFDGDATGIGSVTQSDRATKDDAWYTLDGQRVTAPGKGIYIKNGKKVVVK